MRRRTFITLLGGAAAAWPLAARAQERVRQIGLLYGGSRADPQGQAGLAAFTKAMREMGWVPGSNVAIEQRFADGDADRARTLKGVDGLTP
jgi:putative ABC transport system substrate-binding protein